MGNKKGFQLIEVGLALVISMTTAMIAMNMVFLAGKGLKKISDKYIAIKLARSQMEDLMSKYVIDRYDPALDINDEETTERPCTITVDSNSAGIEAEDIFYKVFATASTGGLDCRYIESHCLYGDSQEVILDSVLIYE